MAAPFFVQPTPGAQRRSQMAELLLQRGTDVAPVQHWLQGLGRLGQAAVGGYMAQREDADYARRQQAAQNTLAQALRAAEAAPAGEGGRALAQALAASPDLAPIGLSMEIERFSRQPTTPKYGSPISVTGPDGRPMLIQPPIEGATEPRALGGFAPYEKPDVLSPERMAQNLELRKAGRPETTINVGPKLSPALDKEAVDQSARADTMLADAENMRQFRDLATQTETGFFVPLTLGARRALEGLGFKVGEQTTLQQLFESQSNLMALKFRNPESGFGLTGNTSNRDLEFLKSIPPGLARTPQANIAILTILGAKQRREAQIAQSKAEFITANGTLNGWGAERERVVKNTDMFNDEDRALMAGVGQQQEAPAPRPQSPPSTPLPGGRTAPLPQIGTPQDIEDLLRRYR